MRNTKMLFHVDVKCLVTVDTRIFYKFPKKAILRYLTLSKDFNTNYFIK